jgi:flavin reductase (DIM6/NTAB) family NADH-FMN oxidoreductase RutF
MILTPNDIEPNLRSRLLIGAVLPRPIAWVSSMDSAGNLNLAPFSYFTIAATVPMTLVFCPQIPFTTPRKKDTLRNIEEFPEFVVNITNEDTVQQMNLSATELPYGESEFEWAGVTPAASQTIRVPRVAEAPISFECKLQRIVTVSDDPGGGSAVFGEVQCIHIRDDLYADGKVVIEALRPIGRISGAGYARVTDTFDVQRVPPPKK